MEPMNVFRHVENDRFEIRGVTCNGEPWFKAGDVATSLEYANVRQAVRQHVDADDKRLLQDLMDTAPPPADQPHEVYVNESGVYALIMRSKKPQAKAFQCWVTKVVLPSIRRAGVYTRPVMETDGSVVATEATSRKRLLEEVREVVRSEMREHQVWSFSRRSNNHRELMNMGTIVHGAALRDLDEAEHLVRVGDFLRDRIDAVAWRLHGRKFKNVYTKALKRAKIGESRDEGLPPPVAFDQGEYRILYTEADHELMVQTLADCRPRFEAIAERDAPLFLRPRRGQRSIREFMQAARDTQTDGDAVE